MRQSFFIIAALIVNAAGSPLSGQHLIPAQEMGEVSSFFTRGFTLSDGRIQVIGYNAIDQETYLQELYEPWKVRRVSDKPALPHTNAFFSTLIVNDSATWFGVKDTVFYKEADDEWLPIYIGIDGLEVTPEVISNYDGNAVVVSSWEYEVIQRDTVNGIVVSLVNHRGYRIQIVSPENRKTIYYDTVRTRFTNAQVTKDGSIIVGFQHEANDPYCMVKISADGESTLIAAPTAMPATMNPSCVFYSSTGLTYFFNPRESFLDETHEPFAVIYNENTGESSFLEFTNSGTVNNAVDFGGYVVCALFGGLLVIDGDQYRIIEVRDPQWGNYLEMRGVNKYSEDTLIAFSPYGLYVIGAPDLWPTSVWEANPGVVLKSGQNFQMDLTGMNRSSWYLYDMRGQTCKQGSVAAGELTLEIDLNDLSSGLYSLVVNPSETTSVRKTILWTR